MQVLQDLFYVLLHVLFYLWSLLKCSDAKCSQYSVAFTVLLLTLKTDSIVKCFLFYRVRRSLCTISSFSCAMDSGHSCSDSRKKLSPLDVSGSNDHQLASRIPVFLVTVPSASQPAYRLRIVTSEISRCCVTIWRMTLLSRGCCALRMQPTASAGRYHT